MDYSYKRETDNINRINQDFFGYTDANSTYDISSDIGDSPSDHALGEELTAIKQISAHKKSFNELDSKAFFSMDDGFVNYLKVFILNERFKNYQKYNLKYWFFGCIMLILILITASPIILMFLLHDRMTDSAIIISILAEFANILSALIILPKIIAEYLFNKKEDEKLIDFISQMQNYNQKKHDFLSNNKEDQDF